MKYIYSPTSTLAMSRLNYDTNIKDDLLEINLNKNLYEKIWNSNFFNDINITLNKYIDDYENEEIIELSELIKLREINNRYKNIDDFFTKLEILINNAINHKTGIFFFF